MAKRTVDGQDMLYQSMKLTNGIWVLAELKGQTGSPNYMVSTMRCAIVEQSGEDLKSGLSVLRVWPHVACPLRCCSVPPSHWQAALKPGCQHLLSAANFRNPALLFLFVCFSELRPTSRDKTLKMQ